MMQKFEDDIIMWTNKEEEWSVLNGTDREKLGLKISNNKTRKTKSGKTMEHQDNRRRDR